MTDDRVPLLEGMLSDLFGGPRRVRKPKATPEPMSTDKRAAMVERVRNQPRHPKTCAAIVNRRNADCDCGAFSRKGALR